jgi:hypothetical protein
VEAVITIQILQDICYFGYMGYIRKKAVWYFKPYTQYVHLFGTDDAKIFQHNDLRVLAGNVHKIITAPQVAA